MRIPPKKLNRKSAVASTRENVPVTAAAMANWNATMPEASLMSDSPSRMLVSLESDATATASVGPSAAPSAKAANKLMDGTSQWTANPTTSAVASTSPMASDSTGLRLRHSDALSMFLASS